MNPYKILGIGRDASKREILQAAALAMRQRTAPIQELATAQRELIDPVTRATHDFLHWIDVAPLLSQLSLERQADHNTAGDLNLPRLEIFDRKDD